MAVLKSTVINGNLQVNGGINAVDFLKLNGNNVVLTVNGNAPSANGNVEITTGGTGTVTSVRVAATSPLVSSVNTAQQSTLDTTISLANANANTVLAGPSSGTAAAPSYRALVASDIPALDYLASTTRYCYEASASGNNLSLYFLNGGDSNNGSTITFTPSFTYTDVGAASSGHDHDTRYVRFDTNAQGLTDTQKSNARTNIGAGTSNLVLGSTATTAASGNHTHDYSAVYLGINATASDSTKLGGQASSYYLNYNNFTNTPSAVLYSSQTLTTTEKEQARTNIGAGTSNLAIGTTSTTAASGNHTHALSIAASTGTAELALNAGSVYKLTAGGSEFLFQTPSDSGNDNYYHTPVYTSTDGFKLATGTGVSDMYIPYAASNAAGILPDNTGNVFSLVSLTSTAGNSSSSAYLSVKWTGTLTGNTTPYAGMKVVVQVPRAGLSTVGVILSIDGGTTYYPVVYNINTVLTSHYGVGTCKLLTFVTGQTAVTAYPSTSTSQSYTSYWRCEGDYDSTNIYQLRQNYSIWANKSGYYTNRYSLQCEVNGGLSSFAQPKVGGTSASPTYTYDTSVTKVPITPQYIPGGQIFYYSTNGAIANNSNLSAGGLYQQVAVDLRYSFNIGTSVLVAGKPVYIKCSVNSNGTISPVYDMRINTTATTQYHPIVTELPSTADGKVYLYLGRAYNTSSIELSPVHPIYEYKDSRIQEWQPFFRLGGTIDGPVTIDYDSDTPVNIKYDNNEDYFLNLYDVDSSSTVGFDVVNLSSNDATWVHIPINSSTETLAIGATINNSTHYADASGVIALGNFATTDTKNTVGATVMSNGSGYMVTVSSNGTNPQSYIDSRIWTARDSNSSKLWVKSYIELDAYNGGEHLLLSPQSLFATVTSSKKVHFKVPTAIAEGTASRYWPLDFTINGSTYVADSSGIVNFGSIGGGGTAIAIEDWTAL